LFFFRLTQYQGTPPSELKPDSEAVRLIQKDPGLFRIMRVLDEVRQGQARVRDFLHPNAHILHGLSSIEGYDPLFPRFYADFLRNFQTDYEKDPAMILAGPEGGLAYSVAGFLNVKYVVTSTEKNLGGSLPLVFEDARNRLWRNPFYQPRAFLLYEYQVLEGKQAILDHLKAHPDELTKRVVLEERPSIPMTGRESMGQGEVRITRYEPHEVSLEVRAGQNGLLVLTDTFYPGWHATLDGEPAEILKANYAFRALEIPKGAHVVRFSFRPASFKIGLFVSLGFVLAFFCLVRFHKRVRWTVLRAQAAGTRGGPP